MSKDFTQLKISISTQEVSILKQHSPRAFSRKRRQIGVPLWTISSRSFPIFLYKARSPFQLFDQFFSLAVSRIREVVVHSSSRYPRVALRELGARRQAACVGASRCTRIPNAHCSVAETSNLAGRRQRSRRSSSSRSSPALLYLRMWCLARNSANAL